MKDFRALMMGFYNLSRLPEMKMAQHIGTPYFSNEAHLRKVLANERGNFGQNVLALPAPGRISKAKVAMWCEWDFSKSPATCSIQILIARDREKVWGFRVDPPHPPRDGLRKHDYWHTQFTRSFKNEFAVLFPQCSIDWIDESTPSYPIALENPGEVCPYDALVYVLISIYGQDIHVNLKTLLMSMRCSTSLRHILA